MLINSLCFVFWKSFITNVCLNQNVEGIVPQFFCSELVLSSAELHPPILMKLIFHTSLHLPLNKYVFYYRTNLFLLLCKPFWCKRMSSSKEKLVTRCRTTFGPCFSSCWLPCVIPHYCKYYFLGIRVCISVIIQQTLKEFVLRQLYFFSSCQTPYRQRLLSTHFPYLLSPPPYLFPTWLLLFSK